MYARIVAFLWLLQCISSIQSSDLQCPTSEVKKTENQIFVNIRRNQTGHWLTQVGLKNKGGLISDDEFSGEGWTVDVSQSTSNCGGRHSTLDTIVYLTAPPPQLGPDYQLFPGLGYFKFHAVPQSWQRAKEICTEEGTHLAIPNSEREVDVYKQLFEKYPKIPNSQWNDWAWVGIHEVGKDNEYVTVFGEPFSSTGYSRWHTGEAHDVGTDDALLVYRQTGALADGGSVYKCGFICEREF